MVSANAICKPRKGRPPTSEEQKTMTYTRPEVTMLGEAVGAIESHIKGCVGVIESFQRCTRLSPAYDLDE